MNECHVCAGASRDQKRASDFQMMEIQVAVSHPKRVLRTKLKSFARVVGTINTESSISPTLI